MSSLINPQFLSAGWNSQVGRVLPNPQSNVGLTFDTLKFAEPEEMAGPAGETFVASAQPQDLATAEEIRSVVAGVERESARVRAFDGVAGRDGKEGPSVASCAGSAETYRWEPDLLDWSGGRRAFQLNDGQGALYEHQRLASGLEIFASKTGEAPTHFVIFDSANRTYRAFDETELASQPPQSGLIGGP